MSENLIAEIRLFVCLFSLKSALPARRGKSVLVGEASGSFSVGFQNILDLGAESLASSPCPQHPSPLLQSLLGAFLIYSTWPLSWFLGKLWVSSKPQMFKPSLLCLAHPQTSYRWFCFAFGPKSVVLGHVLLVTSYLVLHVSSSINISFPESAIHN